MGRGTRSAVESSIRGWLLAWPWLLVACGDVVGTPIDAVRGGPLGQLDATVPWDATTAAQPGPDPMGDAAVAPMRPQREPSDAPATDAGVVGGAVGNVENTVNGDVPDSAYCAPVATWPSEDAAAEQRMLEALLALRVADDFECTSGRPLGPLSPSPELRCSARIHSLDMVARGFLDITGPDGTMPTDRMTQAGLRPDRWGEVVERGVDPNEVLARIVQDNPWGCPVLGDPRVERVGVGYHGGRWTLDFAAPF